MMPITDYCHAGLYTYDGESMEYVISKAKSWAEKTFGYFSIARTRHSTNLLSALVSLFNRMQ